MLNKHARIGIIYQVPHQESKELGSKFRALDISSDTPVFQGSIQARDWEKKNHIASGCLYKVVSKPQATLGECILFEIVVLTICTQYNYKGRNFVNNPEAEIMTSVRKASKQTLCAIKYEKIYKIYFIILQKNMEANSR